MTPTVSILIKALNEEAKIQSCLDSACRAVSDIDGEIVLVDSMSTDKTVEIAKRYPVRIIQFKDKGDIGCGAAVQLGYEHAKGTYIYVLDGDMQLAPDFLRTAIKFLQDHSNVAGVGGKLVDTSLKNSDDRRRQQYYSRLLAPINVDHLAGGGLYRREAIESAGYLANRWLQAAEELELGLRLVAASWKLVRLPDIAVLHTGHDESSLSLVRRLLMRGRMSAYGVLLRNAVGKPWFFRALMNTWFVFLAPLMYIGAILLAPTLSRLMQAPVEFAFVNALTVILISIWFVLSLRKKSPVNSVISLATWHLFFLSAAKGFISSPRNPMEAIPSNILVDESDSLGKR